MRRVALLALVALAGCGAQSGLRIAAPAQHKCGPSTATLGKVAYVSGRGLYVLDFATCRIAALLTRGATGPVRLSPDGRWVAFGRASVVSIDGRQVLHPLDATIAVGTGPPTWAWAPRSDLFAGVTSAGGLVVATPGGAPRRLLPDGFGAQALAFAPNGGLAVSRKLGHRRPELWIVDPSSGAKRLVYRDPSRSQTAALDLDGFAGAWLLFWRNTIGSASIAADGLPLDAVPAGGGPVKQLAPLVLADTDFIERCGAGVVLAAGGLRETTLGKRLVATAPPSWRSRPLSPKWMSAIGPACSPDARTLAAAAGASHELRAFGDEGRAIWLYSLNGRRERQLTDEPPAGVSDESPRWSRDGRFVLYVRSGPTRSNAEASGRLYLAPTGGRGTVHPIGPLAQVSPAPNYYGTYGWSNLVDWYQP
jgi:Tol biopolymer transport system component